VYQVELTESYFPAQTDSPIRETTVGGILREAVESAPKSIALVEASMDGQLGREWSYASLLSESEKLPLL